MINVLRLPRVFTRAVFNCFSASVSWSAAIGLLGGTAWCAMWLMLGIPVLSVLLGGLEMGFLFSGVIFNLTPFGEYITHKVLN